MYEKWIIKKWDTAIYNKKLNFRSLYDADKLVITVTTVEEVSETYEVEFVDQYAYRNYDESYREGLWEHIETLNLPELGNTWLIEDSDLLKMLNDDCNFRALNVVAIHYVVCTMYGVVEIVAGEKPIIRKIG